MSTPNQKSITSFFPPPKHPRPNLESEVEVNRPTKIARVVSAPTLTGSDSDMEEDNFDINKEGFDDELLSVSFGDKDNSP